MFQLSDIKIDVPMENSSLKMSEPINDKYNGKIIILDSDIPKLPNIKMEIMSEAPVQAELEIHPGLEKAKIENVSLKASESISKKYNDEDVNSDTTVPNQPKVRIISQNAKEAQSNISEATRQIEKVSLENSGSIDIKYDDKNNKYDDKNINDPVEKVFWKTLNPWIINLMMKVLMNQI